MTSVYMLYEKKQLFCFSIKFHLDTFKGCKVKNVSFLDCPEICGHGLIKCLTIFFFFLNVRRQFSATLKKNQKKI